MTEFVSSDAIKAAKAKFKGAAEKNDRQGRKKDKFDVGAYLNEYSISNKLKDNGKGQFYCLDKCLFDSSHVNNDASIIQGIDGKLRYQCFHNSCKGRTWKEARKKISGDDKLTKFGGKKPTQAESLLGVVEQQVELFHTSEDDIFGRLKIDEHYETWNVRSRGFRKYLSNQFYIRVGKPPSSQAMNDALTTIEGIGQFDRPGQDVHIRVAGGEKSIYLDLANEDWEVVEITADGWHVKRDSPVPFRRTRGMLPLPVPEKNGDISKLKELLNLPDAESWILTTAWIIQALRPTGPYPVLVLNGEQGSAKSSLSKAARGTIDPSTAPLRSTPKKEHDLAITANNGWVLAFDNLSGVRDWLSDALCRISTGGGFATRELWTNDEEALFSATRPIILNGIDDMVARHDLADRAIYLTLPPIPEQLRIPEAELTHRYSEALPSILGGLCDAISMALKNIDNTRLVSLPRMADFALWISAAEPALPWEPGQFMEVYAENRSQVIECAIESDVVGSTVRDWMSTMSAKHWEGTAGVLKATLEEFADEKVVKGQDWPKDPARLSIKLRRASSFLRTVGIEINFDTKSRPRKIVIDRLSMKNTDDTDGNGDPDSKTDSTDSKGQFTDIKNPQQNQLVVSTDSTDSKIPTLSLEDTWRPI